MRIELNIKATTTQHNKKVIDNIERSVQEIDDLLQRQKGEIDRVAELENELQQRKQTIASMNREHAILYRILARQVESVERSEDKSMFRRRNTDPVDERYGCRRFFK